MAAFNIGFGARTAVSAFQIFPNAVWKAELEGERVRKLEEQWGDIVLLVTGVGGVYTISTVGT